MEDMMPVSKDSQSGFSLIEMLVAMIILAVGLLGMAELQITAIKGNSKSGSLLSANSVAQTALEEVMAVSTLSDPLYGVLSVAADSATDWPVNPVRSIDGLDRFQITDTSTLDVGGSGVTRVNIQVDSLDAVSFGGTRATSEAFRYLANIKTP